MKQKILKILSDSKDYVSGEKLSELCGISRTAIWKHINNLKDEGYEIHSQPRIGYRLIKRPDALLKTEILAGLHTSKWGKEFLYTFEEVDSTNNLAKKFAAEGQPEGTVVVAEQQLQGKGRLGRTWISPKGKGIWVSVILRPNILPTKSPQITFVLAVGMIKALRKILPIKAKIKWPNDILINKQKVAGILTELSAEIERVNYIVFGIGVNVNQDKEEFPIEFRDKATSLKSVLGYEVSRVKVLQAMLEEIEISYNQYLEQGFQIVLDEWKDNSLTLGQQVEVIMDNQKLEGQAVDVDQDGCLIVKDKNNCLHKIIAGDVSLRGHGGKYV
ncbi:MAG: BirA family transcriptional regulator [Clostridia bacterium]|nr:BirA family transcriptional regulator [Clostridia bacterium]MDN5322240.1 BirA family transcriptional regulator [Clostridia bacterium]